MKKQKYANSRKSKALEALTFASLDDDSSDLTLRCKFNFSYFDYSQKAGQNFSDLSAKQLREFMKSLKNITSSSLAYWKSQSTLVMYNKFPVKTEFKHPVHVPHQVCWGRFRLGNKLRLVGFTVPSKIHGTYHHKTKELYDKNTFYVVFIDQNHLFWKTDQR